MFIVEKIISSATCIVRVAYGELDWLENVAGSDFVHMYSAIVS
jgi:hypothetical protein